MPDFPIPDVNPKTFLGFHLGTHDSNVSVVEDGYVRYAKYERLTNTKYGGAPVEFVIDMCKTWGYTDFDGIAFCDLNGKHGMGVCEKTQCFKEVSPIFGSFGSTPTFCLDHHYAHALSAWPVVPTQEVDYGIAIDGGGDCGKRKQIVKDMSTKQPELIDFTQTMQFPKLLIMIGRLAGLKGKGHSFPGKVMSIKSYGQVDHDYIKSVDMEDIDKNSVLSLFDKKYPWKGETIPNKKSSKHQVNQFFSFDSTSFRDWLATVHHIADMHNLWYFKKHCDTSSVISYTGGGAQNSVFNQTLFEHFPNLHIPPHPYDGGLSLGCIEFLRILHDEPLFSTDGFPYWQHDDMTEQPTDKTIKRVVDLLKQGKIVGWYQGRGEIGPRALGHRSILMDPRIKDAKVILNSRVKHREMWRPYAPSILESYVGDYFVDVEKSPFMLRCVTAKEHARDVVPSVIHVDNTSRIQTVEDNPSGDIDCFARLLNEFHKQTGVPMLLNTSLNGGGLPIAGNLRPVFELFENTELDVICAGNQLIVK